jgi:putative resolvase
MRIYKPQDFDKMSNRTASTLQCWDRDGCLKAHRTSANGRHYSHKQYLEFIGQTAGSHKQRIVY